MPKPHKTLDAALAYLQRGWSVIPLCPPTHEGCNTPHLNSCKNPGKGPLVPWTTYQKRTPSENEVKLLFRRNYECNVGIVMGQVSNLVGLDIDGPDAPDLLQQISQGDLPDTLSFKTPGGGQRLLYSLPENTTVKKEKHTHLTSHLLILGEGSYTVAPPSIHTTGRKYPEPTGTLTQAPSWLLQPRSGDEHGKLDGSGVPTHDFRPNQTLQQLKRAKSYLHRCKPCIEGEDGSGLATYISQKLIWGFHLTPEEALPLVMTEYNQKCIPPWSEKEWWHKLTWIHSKGYGATMGQSTYQPAKLVSTKFTDIETKPIEWLWPGWIPLGKLTILDGDPGLGKSTLLLDLAARVSRNGLMPNGVQGITGTVAVLSAEDSAEDTMKPRLTLAGFDPEKVYDLSEIDTEEGKRPPELPHDLFLIEKFLHEVDARLLIIDPLIAFIVNADVNKDQEVRRALYKLSKMAERTKTSIIAMRHLNKTTGNKAIYRGNMSIGVIGHARTGLLVAQDPDDDTKRILAVTKCNLAPMPKSLTFSLEPLNNVCRIGWIGQADYTADDLLKQPQSEEDKAQSEIKYTKRHQCKLMIQHLLSQGKMERKRVVALCAEAGFGLTMVERSGHDLQVTLTCEMVDNKQKYFWHLTTAPENDGGACGPQPNLYEPTT
jgi:archaellum biogenesis ATPase FlaH